MLIGGEQIAILRRHAAQHGQHALGVVVRRRRLVPLEPHQRRIIGGHVWMYSSGAESMSTSPFCIVTTVSAKALDALLENGDAGAYRDEHPWLAAAELFTRERAEGRSMPIVFASGTPLALAYWASI